MRDAVRVYKDLTGTDYKALGVIVGSEAVDLILRLPIRPGEPPVEDVLDLSFLERSGWKSKPGFMTAVHELAVCLMIRYCLFRGCLIPAPKKKALSRGLREKYLPDVPGDFNTAIHWIDVAGVGRLSPAKFRKRYRQGDDALFHPLVLRIGACGMTRHGRYAALEVTPWQFHLLARRSQERLDQNKTRRKETKMKTGSRQSLLSAARMLTDMGGLSDLLLTVKQPGKVLDAAALQSELADVRAALQTAMEPSVECAAQIEPMV